MRNFKAASLLRGLVIVAACHASAQAAAPAYTIVSLGINTSGLAVSANGTYVTGYDFNSGEGFVWTQAGGKQTFSPLVTVPTRPFAEANGVNDSGVAGGSIQRQSYGEQPLPVTWTGTNGTTLPLPDGVTIGAGYDINNAGTVAGAINVNVSDWYATVFSSTGATVLTQPTTSGAILQFAYGIADTGRVVGQATGTSGGGQYAYYLDAGAATAVEIPGGEIAWGISQSGSYITGVSGTNSFVFAPATGTSTLVPMVPGWTSAETRGVNDLGQAVGYGGAAGSVPFLFDGSSTYTLQSLLSGTDATQWNMINSVDNAAFGISNNGIITGRAEHNGALSGFVMVPVPEPTVASFVVISAALIGLALRGRRDDR